MLNILNSNNKLASIHSPVLLFGIAIIFCTFFPFWNVSAEEISLPVTVENIHVSSSRDENESSCGVIDALWGQPSMDSVYLGM